MPIQPPQTYENLQCLVSVPNRARQEPWPVLLFLHGRDEAAPRDINEALTLHGPLRRNPPRPGTEDFDATENFIIVAPQLPRPGGDVWANRAQSLPRIVQAVRQDYNGDPARTYLTGFSFGGNGVLDVGPQQSGIWAALWAVDPTRVPRLRSTRPLWVSAGREASRQEDALRGVLGLRNMGDDPAANFIYHYVGPGHGTVARDAYAAPEVYQWLINKSL